MAWAEQCKVAFEMTVIAKKHSGEENKSLNSILRDVAEESDIPVGTLKRWWSEAQNAKRFKNEPQTVSAINTISKPENKDGGDGERPICSCGRPVEMGKPKKDGTRSYLKTCWKCRKPKKGKQETAPKQDTKTADDLCNFTEALRWSGAAISTLERIEHEDPNAKKALLEVIQWCKNKLNSFGMEGKENGDCLDK